MDGENISWKFLNENPSLTEGDILFSGETVIIVVSIVSCECIVLQPENMFQMASACYEIGNKHLPVFYETDQLLVPFELPLFNLLKTQGYNIKKESFYFEIFKINIGIFLFLCFIFIFFIYTICYINRLQL